MENGDDVQLQVADRLMENGDAISLSQTCVAPFLLPWQRKQEVTKSSNPECSMQCQSVKHEALPWRCHDFCHVSVSADSFLCHVSVMSYELGLQPIFKLHHELPWIFHPRTGHCNLNSYLEGCHVPVWILWPHAHGPDAMTLSSILFILPNTTTLFTITLARRKRIIVALKHLPRCHA